LLHDDINVIADFRIADDFGLRIDLHEKIGSEAGGGTDDLVVGDVNLVYRFAQSELACLRSGLGFRMLADCHRSDFGFNFTYGGDVFPVRPLVLSGLVDLGNLGSAFVVHGRASAGVVYSGWEFFLGYDFLRIGTVNLQGPMLGVRLWF